MRAMPKKTEGEPKLNRRAMTAEGACACGAVRFEIEVPAMWAWHDHSTLTRRAHGSAAAVYVGTWKSRFRLLEGEKAITRFREDATGATRGFCRRCGCPLFYERARSPKALNIPRALFESGVGREPRYHVGIEEQPEWAYRGAKLKPLKGFPGVVWEGPGKRRKSGDVGLF
jgi:hypothetical protein